jgi:hypothetical protein
MNPKGMDGENQLSGISAPVIQTAAIVLAAVTTKGADTDTRYQIGLNRHSKERLNNRRRPSLSRVMNIVRIVAIKEAGIPTRTSFPPRYRGS